MAHEVGYARVSRREQNPDAQAAELRAAGCERVFVGHGESSRVADRPQWLACLDYLRPGDTLKVRRLDRLAGSERILIETLQDLDTRQVNIVSLTEPMIDTTSPMGRALYGIVAVFAQLRVDTIRDNTQRALDYAKSQGRVGGRPSVMTAERIATTQRMRAENHSWESIGRALGVGASSVRRALSEATSPQRTQVRSPRWLESTETVSQRALRRSCGNPVQGCQGRSWLIPIQG
ncbi:recombinase family protein, partial [Pseudokineococcus basanitobsidens]